MPISASISFVLHGLAHRFFFEMEAMDLLKSGWEYLDVRRLEEAGVKCVDQTLVCFYVGVTTLIKLVVIRQRCAFGICENGSATRKLVQMVQMVGRVHGTTWLNLVDVSLFCSIKSVFRSGKACYFDRSCPSDLHTYIFPYMPL